MTNHARPTVGAGGFRKSSFSTDTADPHCVYVARLIAEPTVELRDSKRGLEMPGITVGSTAFQVFVAGMNAADQRVR
jgi:uncharacterized protein DUF397